MCTWLYLVASISFFNPQHPPTPPAHTQYTRKRVRCSETGQTNGETCAPGERVQSTETRAKTLNSHQSLMRSASVSPHLVASISFFISNTLWIEKRGTMSCCEVHSVKMQVFNVKFAVQRYGCEVSSSKLCSWQSSKEKCGTMSCCKVLCVKCAVDRMDACW